MHQKLKEQYSKPVFLQRVYRHSLCTISSHSLAKMGKNQEGGADGAGPLNIAWPD